MGFDVMDVLKNNRETCVNCKVLVEKNRELSDRIKKIEIEIQQLNIDGVRTVSDLIKKSRKTADENKRLKQRIRVSEIEAKMARKLKKWNGMLFFHQDDKGKKIPLRKTQLKVSICAYSQKDAVSLLHEHGYNNEKLHHLREYWSNCWGNSMDGIEPERGMWVEFEMGKPVKVEPRRKEGCV